MGSYFLSLKLLKCFLCRFLLKRFSLVHNIMGQTNNNQTHVMFIYKRTITALYYGRFSFISLAFINSLHVEP